MEVPAVSGRPPEEQRCTATSRRTGERCGAWAMSGRSVCYHHGGRSPRGIGLPQFDHGRYSVSVPAKLSESYTEALADPKKLELDNELAVLVARNREMLASLYDGDSDGLRLRLRAEKRAMEKARRDGDDDAAAEHLGNIMRMIERGASDAERWGELSRNFDLQKRLVESERKRRIEEHQMATTEEVMALMGAVVHIVTRHVRDERIRRAIGYDVEALINWPEEPNGN
jgi:hypothetical protein